MSWGGQFWYINFIRIRSSSITIHKSSSKTFTPTPKTSQVLQLSPCQLRYAFKREGILLRIRNEMCGHFGLRLGREKTHHRAQNSEQ